MDDRCAPEHRCSARRDGDTSGDHVFRVLVLDELEPIVEALREHEREALVGTDVAVVAAFGLAEGIEVARAVRGPAIGHVVG